MVLCSAHNQFFFRSIRRSSDTQYIYRVERFKKHVLYVAFLAFGSMKWEVFNLEEIASEIVSTRRSEFNQSRTAVPCITDYFRTVQEVSVK